VFDLKNSPLNAVVNLMNLRCFAGVGPGFRAAAQIDPSHSPATIVPKAT